VPDELPVGLEDPDIAVRHQDQHSHSVVALSNPYVEGPAFYSQIPAGSPGPGGEAGNPRPWHWNRPGPPLRSGRIFLPRTLARARAPFSGLNLRAVEDGHPHRQVRERWDGLRPLHRLQSLDQRDLVLLDPEPDVCTGHDHDDGHLDDAVGANRCQWDNFGMPLQSNGTLATTG
jgi:hypothetical protein